MSQTTDLTGQAERLSGLLHEYADKVMALCGELLAVLRSGEYTRAKHAGPIAWLFDRADVLRKPLLRITSQAVQLLERERFIDNEGDKLDPITADELAIRVSETESQIHHMLRLADELRKAVEASNIAADVARLRASAGLNAMKGGPLRPDG